MSGPARRATELGTEGLLNDIRHRSFKRLHRVGRTGLRASSRYLPALYNWRSQHNVLLQRMRGGVHDPDFAFLARLELPDPIVIDVGANTGQTLQTIKTLLPRARVVCIEPSPMVIPALVRLSRRYEDVSVAPFAVGSQFDTSTINTPSVRGVIFTQNASLGDIDTAEIAAVISGAGFGATVAADIRVRRDHCVIAPLDAMFTECDVLKVDAEGYEDHVFDGAPRLLKHSLPIIIVERPSQPLREALTGLGYTVMPGTSSVNTVLVHPDRPRGLLAGP